jgi:hypothetical protein
VRIYLIKVYMCAAGAGATHPSNGIDGGTGDETQPAASNELLSACPSYRNEIGAERTRRLALCRATTSCAPQPSAQVTWHREANACEAGE